MILTQKKYFKEIKYKFHKLKGAFIFQIYKFIKIRSISLVNFRILFLIINNILIICVKNPKKLF